MAGLFFHDLTRIPAGGGFKRPLGRGTDSRRPEIWREGPILMGRDKQKRPVQRRNGDPARVLAPQGGLGGSLVPSVLDLLQFAPRVLSDVRDDPLANTPGRGSSQMGGRGRDVFALEDLNADAGSLEPWYDSPHGEDPGSRKEEIQWAFLGGASPTLMLGGSV